jgi:hypothetical protein
VSEPVFPHPTPEACPHAEAASAGGWVQQHLGRVRNDVKSAWETFELVRTGHGRACIAAWWAAPQRAPAEAGGIDVETQLVKDPFLDGTYFLRIKYLGKDGREISPTVYLRAEGEGARAALAGADRDRVHSAMQERLLTGAIAYGQLRDATVENQTKEILFLSRENIRLERELAAKTAEAAKFEALYEAARAENTEFIPEEFAPQALEIFNVFAAGGLTEPAARESLLVRATVQFFAGTLLPNEQIMAQLMPVDRSARMRLPVDGLRAFAGVFNPIAAKSSAKTPVGGAFVLRLPEAPAPEATRQLAGASTKRKGGPRAAARR